MDSMSSRSLSFDSAMHSVVSVIAIGLVIVGALVAGHGLQLDIAACNAGVKCESRTKELAIGFAGLRFLLAVLLAWVITLPNRRARPKAPVVDRSAMWPPRWWDTSP